MELNAEILTGQLANCIKGLIQAFDSEVKRWRSAMEDDIFTNYVAIWALAGFNLATVRQAKEAAQWIFNRRNPRSSRWTDSTGSKPIEMTNRALIAHILSECCRSYREIDLYVNWILNVQKQHGGAWIQETKHMGGKTSYGPTLPATFLLRLIRDKLKPDDERLGQGLDTARAWLIGHYERDTIWNFHHLQGDVDHLAVTWALRIYGNCTDEPHQLQQDGVTILKKYLRNGQKTWTLDKYQLLYNCLHSLALCGIGLDNEVTVSLAQWLMKKYEKYDFAELSAEPEGVRKLCGMLITISRALQLTEDGRDVVVTVRERTLAALGGVVQVESYRLGQQIAGLGRDVFVVHGHDEGTKETVARFIGKLGLKAIILHEQPDAGRTIIEKFEHYSNVGFAVVLITPDDTGGPKGKPKAAKLRARQNVVFELGYFIGKLGRKRVRALCKGEVEIPSDYQGVLYILMDSAGAWREKLATEIKATGIDVNYTV